MQYLKLLYLNKHRPSIKTPPDKETLLLFEQKFKNTFKDAFDVQQIGDNDFSKNTEITKNNLNSNSSTTVFEAGFIQAIWRLF